MTSTFYSKKFKIVYKKQRYRICRKNEKFSRTLKIVQKIFLTEKTKNKMIALLGVQKLPQTLKIFPTSVRARE
jgi:hypothetical protein